ncbi:NAD-dependent epimerase/dehydratase family protein [Paenibacillus sp. CN-4]|uniref:NAD-dependent epimerase/dehydratase family protein n=1 Tax=Paenibacillus nanchangensis TaxID=3348343 RepID=UPI00397DFF9B
MRFLVTGCSGFIGSRLTTRLLEQGHSVRGLVLPKEIEVGQTLAQLGMELWVGDMLCPETLDGIAEDIDVVYHLAGKHSASISRMSQLYVEGTRNLLDQLRSSGTDGKFIAASNGAVYGSGSEFVADESAQCDPVHPFGRLTLEMERLVQQHCTQGSWSYIILRIAEVYGPHEHNYIRQFMRSAQMLGDGSNYSSKAHIDDVVSIMQLAWSSLAVQEVYNVSDDLPLTQEQLIKEIQKYVQLAEIQWISPDAVPERIRLSIHGLRALSVRMANEKIKHYAGVRLEYPTYIQAIPYLIEEMLNQSEVR